MSQVTADDHGKPVIDANGERIATVEEIDDGTPLVDPVAEINPTTTRALGWTNSNGPEEDSPVPLRRQAIETVTEDAVRLEKNL